MSSTVNVGAFEHTSSSESAEEMVEALDRGEDAPEPEVVEDRGEPVDPEKAEATEAARKLGRRGGEASARARREAEGVPEGEDAPEGQPAGKPRSDPQARVRQATDQLAEVRREKKALEERLARLERVAVPAQDPRAYQTRGRPELKDFDGEDAYERWEEALIDWKFEQRMAQQSYDRAQAHQAQEAAAEVVTTVDTFNERIAEARGVDPEFVEKIDPEVVGWQPSFTLRPDQPLGPHNVAADEILRSERGPELLAHLTAHPEDKVRLLQAQTPREVQRLIAKMEDKLEPIAAGEAPEPRKRPVSKAPPPLRPVNASAPPSTEDITGDLSFDEFMKRKKSSR